MSEEVDKIIDDLGFDDISRKLKVLALAVPLLSMKDSTASDIFQSFMDQYIERSTDAEIRGIDAVAFGFTSYIDIMYSVLASTESEEHVEIFMRFMFEMALVKSKLNFKQHGDEYKKSAEAGKAPKAAKGE